MILNKIEKEYFEKKIQKRTLEKLRCICIFNRMC